MHHHINQVRLRDFLTEHTRLSVSTQAHPHIAIQMEVWLDNDNLTPKEPASINCFSVVTDGTEFVDLLAQVAWEHESIEMACHAYLFVVLLQNHGSIFEQLTAPQAYLLQSTSCRSKLANSRIWMD